MDAERLEEIARRYGIRLLLMFGSAVSGPLHARSDVDLAVWLDRSPLSLRGHADLLGELQKLYPDREVDLAVINRADPLFLKKITERCRLLHGSALDLAELKIYAFKRYQDHRRYLALERAYVARALRGLAAP
ncbi:MAG TPA: nucleotidyltransferase domain-containing protein [Methylomirabilota bacterium]|jgi:predicted nucleotidyltransferase|nr:nucleotidyltransferase domain-containing protein [Methylomirabilota bacterium]